MTGEPCAWVRIPPDVREAMAANGVDEAGSGNPMPMPSALSLAVFVALSAERDLLITGDLSVWQDDWGRLLS